MAQDWRYNRIDVLGCDAEVSERVQDHNSFEQSFFLSQRLTHRIDSSQNDDGLVAEIEVKDDEKEADCPQGEIKIQAITQFLLVRQYVKSEPVQHDV